MAEQCKHEWELMAVTVVDPETYHIRVALCRSRTCDEYLHRHEAEAMLNENATLKRENERIPEYKALASLVSKYRLVYEDGNSGDGVITFDDTELAQGVVDLAEALLVAEAQE